MQRIIIAILFLASTSAVDEVCAEDFSAYVDSEGGISLPRDYRSKWTHLGAWAVPDPKASGAGLHDVFTQPETVATFKETGRWPDGAVLVKEIRAPVTEEMTTGLVTYAGDLVQWFVMVKDTEGRFPDSPVWGKGWGWALFLAADPSKNTVTEYRADCLGCHIPAKSTDWIYVQGYPALK